MIRADLLVTNVNIFNAYMKRFYKGNAAILDGRFLHVGEAGAEEFDAARTVDGRGRYMIPGLIDIHMHIESTMVTPSSFSYGLLPNGVTTIVAEPHEMANVFGLRGVREMIKASKNCAVDIYYAIPSSVPATELETSGGRIELEDIEALLPEDRVICLGEIMNYMEVVHEPDCKTNRILNHILQHHPKLIVEGHVPRLLGTELSRFVFAGVDSDHTQQTVRGLDERIKAGVFVQVQELSMTREVMDYLISEPVSEHFCFVTDDVMPDDFVKKGHLNHLLRKAIGMGMAPEDAIYAGTFTPARRMRLSDRGSIAPGKIADFVLLSSLDEFRIDEVYKNGAKAFDSREEYPQQLQLRQFPDDFYESVKLAPLVAADLVLKAPAEEGTIRCRTMTVADGTFFTEERIDEFAVRGGEVRWQESPYALVATFERYGRTSGNRALGLVGGNTIGRGAIATTYSHDNHNLIVVGRNAEDMLLAANEVIKHQGGYCVTENGRVLAMLKLPVGGILSEEPLEQVAEDASRLVEAMIGLGYEHYTPIMSFSTHSLPVSPGLKITDLGLVRVDEREIVSLFA
ncbi:adenine deaminase [Cohnella thailandensis]|nr:adenine deaminase C-terminal domain-containing protein [Cohnella thailandensis]MBP1974539.1 adenine deaminase [Cohnella thailandensis]